MSYFESRETLDRKREEAKRTPSPNPEHILSVLSRVLDALLERVNSRRPAA